MPRNGSFGSTLAGMGLVALLGCSSETEPQERDPRVVTALTAELSPVVEGNNAFAWSLYQKAAQADGNLFFSPFGISAALGMIEAGAGGDTATEMRDVLAMALDDSAYHERFGALLRDLGGEHPGRGYQLYVANRLFGQSGEPFASGFLDVTGQAYGAPLVDLDFADAEGARHTINSWVSEQTRTRIPELLDPGLIDVSTLLVLANAIYFSAGWAREFEVSSTHSAMFTREDGTQVEVPMMSAASTHRFASAPGFSMVELDYQDDEISMVLLVPDQAGGLAELEAQLSSDVIEGLLEQSVEGEVSVSMPKFEVAAELPLRERLTELGMTHLFDPASCDLSRMVDPPDPGLYLSFAVHKAYVKVDEHGTEAAAATAGGVTRAAAPYYVLADHPFVYAIRDRLTHSILFLGRLSDPSATLP